jgi:hypothetical protein
VVTAANHGFTFNFTDSVHNAPNDYHPAAAGSASAAALAVLSAFHADNHAAPGLAPEGYDAMTQAGIIKAQHHADFHIA